MATKTTSTNASLRATYNSKTKLLGAELTYALEDVKLRLGLTDRTLKEDNKLTDVTIGCEKPGLFRYDWDVSKKAAKFQFQTKATLAKQKVAMKYVHDQKANLATLEGAVPLRDNKDLVTSKSAAVVLRDPDPVFHRWRRKLVALAKREVHQCVRKEMSKLGLPGGVKTPVPEVVRVCQCWCVCLAVRVYGGRYNFASENFDVKYAYKVNDKNTLEPYYDFSKKALSVSLTHQRAKNEKLKATYAVKTNQATLDYTKDLWRVTATMPVKKEKPNPVITFERTWNFTL
eukprot:jgi/Mesvir1/23899/Mv10682-RA.1